MSLSRLAPCVAVLAALAGCAGLSVRPLEAPDPAPVLGTATGVAASVTFVVEGEPDDAGAARTDLSLADALREALLHDPRVQQSLARWQAARAASEEARFLPDPILSVGVLFGTLLSDATVTVGISDAIAAYLQRPRKAGAADARLRSAAEESLAVALDVVAETRETYLAAQEADARRPALAQRLALLTRLLEVHRESLREGEGTPGDVTALDAERAAIDLDLAEIDADRARARIDLARIVGRPSDAGQWTLAAWPALPPAEGAARPWIDRALARRPEVRALGWELAAFGDERALVETWPWEGNAAGVEMEYDEGFRAGPVVEIPLRLFGSSDTQTAALDAAEAGLRHRAVEVRREVIRDVRRALADEAAARRALELLDRGLLPLLERRRTEIDASRREGEAEIAILLLADRDLQDARARRVELERRVLDARIRLERAAGGPGDAPFPAPGPQVTKSGGKSP